MAWLDKERLRKRDLPANEEWKDSMWNEVEKAWGGKRGSTETLISL